MFARGDEGGLDEAEARCRLERFGPNVPVRARERPAWREFLRRFSNPLVLVLLVAGFMAALLGDRSSASIVSVVVVLSVTLDFVQEHRAGKSARALAKTMAPRARVMRSGAIRTIDASEVVPGDLVHLRAGDLVPADGVIVSSRDLFVDEASLTGEPFPAEKLVDSDPSTRRGRLFAGTGAVSGEGVLRVETTGEGTELGRAGRALGERARADAFEQETRHFGLLIMRLTFVLVMVVVAANVLSDRPLFEAFLFAVALAVGLTPELLPMIVSVTLARGALRMGRRQVIVKRLASIHDLGAMGVLCTDKTGTLTEAKVRLERHVDLEGRDSEAVLRLAWLNSRFESGLRSPLDDAILSHEALDERPWNKIDEVPFDFERRRVSVLIDDGHTRLLVVKGAADHVLGLCSDLDETARNKAEALVRSFERDGLRVLGIASREVGREHDHAGVADEIGLEFVGFAAFLDPPKQSARAALEALDRDGVEVKVVTGDAEEVARHVCESIGLRVKGVLHGDDIDRLGPESLARRAERATIFCRTTPAQKARVIRALRGRHVVGYLGDGINDAPSLRAADVGLSVEGASEVAREAADIVLLENDLNVLHAGVREGRRTFANVLRYLLMGTSSNFGNMLSMAAASFVLPFLPMRPVQVLLNNFLYDLSELPIPLDDVDPGELDRPRRWDLGLVVRFMIVAGVTSSIFDGVTFWLLLRVFDATEAQFQSGWFVESIATQVLVILVIRTRGRPWAHLPSPILALTSFACVIIAALLPHTQVGSWFGLVPPPAHWLAVVAGMTAAYLTVVELVKRRFFARLRPPSCPTPRPGTPRRTGSSRRSSAPSTAALPTRAAPPPA